MSLERTIKATVFFPGDGKLPGPSILESRVLQNNGLYFCNWENIEGFRGYFSLL